MPTDHSLSRSSKLVADMHWAALNALAEAPTGQLPRAQILVEVEKRVALDGWARHVYETGNVRWRSLFSWFSIDLDKAGYIVKTKAGWSITPEGRRVIQAPFDSRAYTKELARRYQQWKAERLDQTGANVEASSEHPNPARGQVFLKKQGLMRYKVNGSTKMADMSLVRAHGVS